MGKWGNVHREVKTGFSNSTEVLRTSLSTRRPQVPGLILTIYYQGLGMSHLHERTEVHMRDKPKRQNVERSRGLYDKKVVSIQEKADIGMGGLPTIDKKCCPSRTTPYSSSVIIQNQIKNARSQSHEDIGISQETSAKSHRDHQYLGPPVLSLPSLLRLKHFITRLSDIRSPCMQGFSASVFEK